MAASSVPNYERVLSLEDDFVNVKDEPFAEDIPGSLPAVAVDWNSKQAVFNVTLLSISHDGAEERLWSDSFSMSKITKRHLVLCLVFPNLKNLLPALPKDPLGLWGFMQWVNVPPELCKKLEEYFKNAFDICGWKMFTNVFFGEPIYFDESYTISTSEFKRKHLQKEVQQCLQEFQEHLVQKRNASNIDQLFEWYKAAWDCSAKVSNAEKKLLAFDCEPCEELRDIAQRERSECASMFNQQSMTASTFQDNAQNFTQWEDQYVESVKKINEFRIAHLKIALPRLLEMLSLLQGDSEKFTDDSRNTVVSTKLYEVEKECLQMELELLNCTNQLKVLERDKVRQDALALDEDLSMPEKLNEKEIQVYKKQCEILGISYDIQDKNEKIVRLDLQGLENSEEMETDLDKGILTKALKIVFRKKAILRNKKNICEAEIKKLTKVQEGKREQYVSHHAVQMKIEKRREEDEEMKDARLEEREKTLLRLKEYKKKYPKAKDVKPPRYQPPSVRKKEQKEKGNTSLSINTSARPIISRKDERQQPSPKQNGCSIESNIASSQPITFTPPPQSPGLPSARPSQSPGVPTPPPVAAAFPPPPPPPPPPGIPPPPAPPAIPPLPSGGSALGIKVPGARLSEKTPAPQASSLSQQTLDLDALKVARSRLKKQDDSSLNNKKGLPIGSELTRAIQNVKLRKVVSEEKPAELSPDGAQFLKKALERMNKFTNLSFDEDEGDVEEQEW